jgi:uncharacterized SAM-binding protein YcdF (DUF218 family)
LRARAEAAAALWHTGVAPLIATTGAHHAGPPGEAVVARGILLDAGVPDAAIVLEEKSHDTWGNLHFSRGLLPDAVRVYLVTEPFHLGRAMRMAVAAGFAEPVPWPVDSPAWNRVGSRARLLARDVVSLAFHLAGA